LTQKVWGVGGYPGNENGLPRREAVPTAFTFIYFAGL